MWGLRRHQERPKGPGKAMMKRMRRKRWRFALACIRFIVMLKVRARHGVKLTGKELTTLYVAFRDISQKRLLVDVHAMSLLLERIGHAKPPEQVEQLLEMVGHDEGQLIKFHQFQKIAHRLKQNFVLTKTTDAEEAFKAIGGVGDAIRISNITKTVTEFGLIEPIPSGPSPFSDPTEDAPPQKEDEGSSAEKDKNSGDFVGNSDEEKDNNSYKVSYFEFAALVGEAAPPSLAAAHDAALEENAEFVKDELKHDANASGEYGEIGGNTSTMMEDGENSEDDVNSRRVSSASYGWGGGDSESAFDTSFNTSSPHAHRRKRSSMTRASGTSHGLASGVPLSAFEKFNFRAQRHLAVDAPRVNSRALKKKREVVEEQLQMLPKDGRWRQKLDTKNNTLTAEFEPLRATLPVPKATRSSVLHAEKVHTTQLHAAEVSAAAARKKQHGAASPHDLLFSMYEEQQRSFISPSPIPSSSAKPRQQPHRHRPQSAGVQRVAAGAGQHHRHDERPTTAPLHRNNTTRRPQSAQSRSRIHQAVEKTKLWQLSAEPTFLIPNEQKMSIIHNRVAQGTPSREEMKTMPFHSETQQSAALLLQGFGGHVPADVTNERRSRSPLHERTVAAGTVLRPSSSYGPRRDRPVSATPSSFIPVVGKPT